MITTVRRITLVWLFLLAATAISWTVGHGSLFDSVRMAGVAVVVIAFLKIRYVLLEFMEIRGAPTVMRVVSEGWVILVCGGIVYFYWNGYPA